MQRRQTIAHPTKAVPLERKLGRETMDSRRSTGRRSSVGRAKAGHGSDPRPLQDKLYQQESVRYVISALAHLGYERPQDPKRFSSMNKNDFCDIIAFLYRHIEPNYQKREGVTLDDFPAILRRLHYPAQLQRSQLNSLSAPHCWKNVLGALRWLTELVVIVTTTSSEGMTDVEEQENPEKMFFSYLGKAYEAYLRGDDEAQFEKLESSLVEKFEQKTAQEKQAVDELEMELSDLQKEIDSLYESEETVEKLSKHMKTLCNDEQKFVKYISELDQHRDEVASRTEAMKQELEGRRAQKLELEQEKLRLQTVVANQELSTADVEKMNSEKRQLEQVLESMRRQREQIDAQCADTSSRLESKLREVAEQVQQYNSMATESRLIPASAKYARGIDFEVRFNMQAAHSNEDGSECGDQLLSVDLKGVCMPALKELRSAFQQKYYDGHTEFLSLETRLAELDDVLTDKKAENDKTARALAKVEEEYRHEKQDMEEKLKQIITEGENILNNTKVMRERVHQAFLESQHAMQEVTVRHEQLSKRCSLEREQFSNCLLVTLDTLTSHKTHISETLGALQAHFADALHSLNNNKPLVAHHASGALPRAAHAHDVELDSAESDDNEISFKNVHLIVNQPRGELADHCEQSTPDDEEYSFAKEDSSAEAHGDTDGDTMDLCKTTDLDGALSALSDLAGAHIPIDAQ
eukprot:CAMPEP_0177652514 /NCGR_PEP_ID=MMETSP0447-20121125/13178_1 /TAXON_ID=0 /ORGANISM="Stygamoeba regulata, Strain BSH-02190019" /LENGTH=693 /DNA_ID=CAMNT_0019155779 /DNA_START=246 /DNA_END=2327 /DNA_ORIENTATION=-